MEKGKMTGLILTFAFIFAESLAAQSPPDDAQARTKIDVERTIGQVNNHALTDVAF